MSEQNGGQGHHVEVVSGVVATPDQCETLAMDIERAYARINKLALARDLVIVSTTQLCTALPEGRVCYILTAQWLPREKLEALQRQQAILGSVPPSRRPN